MKILNGNMTLNTPFNYRDTPLPHAYFERKYGTSRPTIRRYRQAGLPAIVVGSKVFIRESDFVAFLERMNGKTAPVNPKKEGQG